MRMKRVFGTATAAALLMAGPISATAMAQAGDPPAGPLGVGTGVVESTLLGIDIGDLLDLDLLDDLGSSTIDPANGDPLADGTFNPLKLTSSVLGERSVGSITTSSTGGEDTESGTTTPANDLLPIVDGVLDGTLSSVVDGDGARSSLLASIGDLELVGGLLGMSGPADGGEVASFTTNAAPNDAGGVRGLNIGSMDLLNLGNLLAGIGMPLEDLPLVGDAGVTSITGLLSGLGVESVPVVGEDGTETDMPTDDAVDSITGLVDTLGVLGTDEISTTPLDSGDCGEVDGLLTGLPVGGTGGIGGLIGGGETMDTCAEIIALPVDDVPLVGELVTTVEDTLSSILKGSLPVLDGLNLLSVGGITAQMESTATDSVETSNADVVAEITSLEVAGMDPLGDLNLDQGAGVLDGVSTTISDSLNGALGLDGLLDIDVLDISEIVEPDGDYTSALSSLTAMAVNLNPDVLGTFGALQAVPAVPISATDILGEGLPGLPVLGEDMLALDGLLDPDGVLSILTEGLGIEVGRMQSTGTFTTVAALPPSIVPPAAQPVTPPADGTLPRTGADTALPAVLAVIMAATAIGIRRMVRTEKVDI